jgi:YfiR/HmsC-like
VKRRLSRVAICSPPTSPAPGSLPRLARRPAEGAVLRPACFLLTVRSGKALAQQESSRPLIQFSLARNVLLLVLISALLFTPGLCEQTSRPSEYQVKTAYLYNFARFVWWPQAATGSNDSFPICVLGQDPFGRALDAGLAGQTVDRRKVVVRRISNASEAAGCHVLFISASEDGRLKTILAALDKEPILTVSDMPQFSERGGMIQFVLEGDRVRFEVNLPAAEDAGLTLSSELLRVAAAIKRNPPSGN